MVRTVATISLNICQLPFLDGSTEPRILYNPLEETLRGIIKTFAIFKINWQSNKPKKHEQNKLKNRSKINQPSWCYSYKTPRHPCFGHFLAIYRRFSLWPLFRFVRPYCYWVLLQYNMSARDDPPFHMLKWMNMDGGRWWDHVLAIY